MSEIPALNHSSEMSAEAETVPSKLRTSRVVTTVAVLALLTGVCSTGILSITHASRLAIPGCSLEDGCGAVEASSWAAVAGWPVAYLGCAYFTAIAAACGFARAVPIGSLRIVVRAGAAI